MSLGSTSWLSFRGMLLSRSIVVSKSSDMKWTGGSISSGSSRDRFAPATTLGEYEGLDISMGGTGWVAMATAASRGESAVKSKTSSEYVNAAAAASAAGGPPRGGGGGGGGGGAGSWDGPKEGLDSRLMTSAGMSLSLEIYFSWPWADLENRKERIKTRDGCAVPLQGGCKHRPKMQIHDFASAPPLVASESRQWAGHARYPAGGDQGS